MFNPDTWTIIALMVGLFFFIWKTNRDLSHDFESKLEGLRESFGGRLAKVENRLAHVEGRLAHMEGRLDTLSDILTGKSQPQ